MGFPVHLHGQLRQCTATTVVEGQSSVTVDGKLWAVNNDPNSHIEGRLVASTTDIWIEGKLVIVHKPDVAGADDEGHPLPKTDTAEGFNSVTVY